METFSAWLETRHINEALDSALPFKFSSDGTQATFAVTEDLSVVVDMVSDNLSLYGESDQDQIKIQQLFNTDKLTIKNVWDISFGTFNPNDWMELKEQRKVDPFIVYGMAASDMALNDADWHPTEDEDRFRTGVLLGSAIGGLQGIEQTSLLLAERGPQQPPSRRRL